MSKHIYKICIAGFIITGICILFLNGAESPYWFKFSMKMLLVICLLFIVLIWSLRRYYGDIVSDEWIKNIILSGVTFLILIFFGEYLIRYVFKDITTTSHNSYFSEKWAKGIRKNSMGFREREIEPKYRKRNYRIVVIGDSFTFGQGIEEKDRFTNLLETELNKSTNGYEVLNVGIPGAETVDEILTLGKVIDKVDPDYVLLQWFINDFEGHDKNRRPQSLPLLPSYALNKYLSGSSAFYFLANIQWQNIQNILRTSGSYEKYMFQRFGDPESADSKIAERELNEFIDFCRNYNIPVGIVLFPELIPEMGTKYPFHYLHDRVISLCQQKNVEYLDLREVFSPYTNGRKEYKKLHVNRLDSHPGPLANRIAAASIMKKFGTRWLP